MSELKICRICLRTRARQFKFNRFSLKYYYEELMGLKVNDKDGLPHYFCFECATILHKFYKFKEKCYRGQKTLKELLWKGPLTYELVHKLDTKAINLTSSLQVLTVSKRVKTFITRSDDCTDIEDVIKDQPKLKPKRIIKKKRKISYRSSVSDTDNFDYDDINEPEIEIPNDSCLDDIPLVELIPVIPSTNDNNLETDEQNLNSQDLPILPLDERKDALLTDNENDLEKEPIGKAVVISPKTKKYKFNSTKKHTKSIDPNNWDKINLTEEDALQELRAKAENDQFIAAPYKCMDCFRGFSKEDMLDRHMKLRHSQGTKECRLCRMRFKRDCLLRRHMRQHFTKYKCLRCQFTCYMEYAALLHDDFHSGVTRKCMHCNEEFRHSSSYYTHLRTHRSEHICSLCGASFVSEVGLQMHKKVKHVGSENENNLEPPEDTNTYCARCDMTFSSRKAYVEHVFHSALHADANDDKTGDSYTVPNKKTDTQLAKNPGKGDANSESDSTVLPFKKGRKKFRRTHRKPMDCHQCGLHFDTQTACMAHHHAAHPGTSFTPPSGRIICEVCGASLAPGSVANHENMHSKRRTFACDTCGRAFYSSVGLKRHLVTHTGEKKYACSLCGKRFTQNGSLSLHFRTFHLKQPYPKRNRGKTLDMPASEVGLFYGKDD